MPASKEVLGLYWLPFPHEVVGFLIHEAVRGQRSK
jgi:hypothetical protein